MSDISIFKEMIKDTSTVSLETHYSKKKVILKEPSPADYSITIFGMPSDDEVIIIKADDFTAPNNIFANSQSECKRADFVIVADTDNIKVIICIEMKGGKGGTEKEIINQLKGAQCFVRYCREIGQSFWNHKNFLDEYEYRFVSFRNISISKKPTRASNETKINDQPDRMLKFSSAKTIQFNHLINK